MLFLAGTSQHARGAEEFRTFRSRLFRIREKRPLKTILVTSALPGEGKSFVAGNLAQMLVMHHKRRALLIDADLRWSRLHQYLGAPATPGLTDYLQGQADECSIVQQSPMENLFFVPGGTQCTHPAELISNQKLPTLLQGFAPLFDWIILDSPPLIPVSDAALLARFTEGVLLVVRAGRTPYQVAQRAREELKDRPVLGVVLNGLEPSAYRSYYHYGKYYKQYDQVIAEAVSKESGN